MTKVTFQKNVIVRTATDAKTFTYRSFAEFAKTLNSFQFRPASSPFILDAEVAQKRIAKLEAQGFIVTLSEGNGYFTHTAIKPLMSL